MPAGRLFARWDAREGKNKGDFYQKESKRKNLE